GRPDRRGVRRRARPLHAAEPRVPMITRSAGRDALLIWFGSRLGLLVTTMLGVAAHAYLGRWERWDAQLFVTIAQYGYDGDPASPDDGLPAFFPGLPLALRLVHLVV